MWCHYFLDMSLLQTELGPPPPNLHAEAFTFGVTVFGDGFSPLATRPQKKGQARTQSGRAISHLQAEDRPLTRNQTLLGPQNPDLGFSRLQNCEKRILIVYTTQSAVFGYLWRLEWTSIVALGKFLRF